MKPVLIGSRALNFLFPARKIKPDADWDVISDAPIEGCEWHDVKHLNNADVLHYSGWHGEVELPDGTMADVMSPLGLAIIKRSHLWRDLSFQKHITDYHKYLHPFLEHFASIDESIINADLYTRIELTKIAYPQGNPNLMQPVQAFFTDAVEKKFSHDWLHELYAYEEQPMYKRMQDNPELAWCKKELWYNLTHTQRLQAVAEEAYVIATERFLVPKDFNYPHKQAFIKSLDKICTTLCSGWFRDFSIQNYPEIIAMYDPTKIEEVKGILNGKKSS